MSLPTYRDYEDSGVAWIGNIPSHWKVDRIKASVSFARNGIWGEEPQGDENDIACVRVADFDRERLEVNPQIPTIRSVTAKERLNRLLNKGDLLLEKSGGGELQPVGQVVRYQLDMPAVCSNFVARICLKQGMNTGYWNYVHSAAYSMGVNIGSINQTSGIQNLDQDRYFNERAPFPPEAEQVGIAAFLDRETAKIDTLIAEQEKLLTLLAEKRQATISHAVTKGLNPDVPMKESGVEWLGEVPEHWEVKQLKHVARPGTSITYGIVQAGPHFEGGVPYIKTSDMSGDELPLGGYSLTSPEIDSSYSRSKVEAGDIVIAIRATVGKCLPVPPELTGAKLTQGTAKVSPGESVLPIFLLAALRSSSAQNYFDSVAKGATFREITLDALRRTPVAVPQLDEQKRIIEVVTKATSRMNDLIANTTNAIRLLKERRAALISAAVTGQLDVRCTQAASLHDSKVKDSEHA